MLSNEEVTELSDEYNELFERKKQVFSSLNIFLHENFAPSTFCEKKKIFERKIVEWKQSGLETGMKNLKIPLPIQVYSPFIIFSSIVQPFQGFINPTGHTLSNAS